MTIHECKMNTHCIPDPIVQHAYYRSSLTVGNSIKNLINLGGMADGYLESRSVHTVNK